MEEEVHKVAFVATVFRHLEAFHLPFIKMLQKKGVEVHAISRKGNGKQALVDEQVKCHEIEFRRFPFHPANISALYHLIQNFKKEKYKLVHVHTPVGSILGRYAAKAAKIPKVIYTAHGFHFHEQGSTFNWLFYPIEWFFARWTDVLITINTEDAARASSFPVRKKAIFIPGVGVDTGKFGPVKKASVRKQKREELGIPESAFVILCVAEINKNKNQVQLLRAIRLLKTRYPQIKCLLVGEGNGERELKKYVKDMSLQAEVMHAGFRTDIDELLAAADLFCLTSKREGLPKAVMEAMSAGKPVIATKIRGCRDLITHGENGYLVPVNNHELTASYIAKLIENPSLLERMGESSLQLVRQFELSSILSDMEKVYVECLMDPLKEPE
ncbi:glycosyltransferase family 4 protein [Bacillus sp. SG-1]|uniref:glycosyltransferase family 4 protein n=1 Tax=Bacillus sp. SG-1 TaxID=161544 RepID=UPI000154356C|nr:glycosyltransferase family 4 protein [Bacillus sp. SG-1]EDL65260.1 Glycosyl transferase, group 1 [Bacillus sp. SG-1]